MSKDYTWEQAMYWWKNSGAESEIRDAAYQLLEASNSRMGCEGQGIGSSDTNHEVYHMYSHYLSYVTYCEERNLEVTMEEFLRDVLCDIA